jgi:5'-nucleotidase
MVNQTAESPYANRSQGVSPTCAETRLTARACVVVQLGEKHFRGGNLRILISNDDGIHATGLSVLEDIARTLSDDVWVVAPEVEKSGAGRAITLTEPIRVRHISDKRYACSGTPTDCVLLGIAQIMKATKPDLLLSGINRGQNLAEDTSVSGTVAAAIQGMQMGVPSIALSQSMNLRTGEPIPWETAAAHGSATIKRLIAKPWAANVVLNVNFPDCLADEIQGTEVTRQGFRDEAINHIDERADLRGNAYFWIGYQGKLSKPPLGTDLRAIYENRISVTPLHLDMTEHQALSGLQAVFA